jgi:two-component system KDP operon response regulator KdpE
MRILLVEDEPSGARFIAKGLREAKHAVDVATDGIAASRLCQENDYDAVILDVMLPGKDGLTVCRDLRAAGSDVPVLMLTARDAVEARVQGLDAGADDYLTKPFGVGELLARVRVVLRHLASADRSTGDPVYQSGDLRVDLARREVVVQGRLIHLTPNEFRLLSVLVRHAGKVLTHQHLLKEVWGPGSSQETHYLRVYMNQLRQKLEADGARPKYLLTEPGVGYRLTADARE